MKTAIISDIHSNIEAFEAVLAQIGKDKVYCLGDIVGYGPNPNECVELVREKACVVIAGNHDFGSVGQIDISGFTKEAQFVCRFTHDRLALDNFSYLKELFETASPQDNVTLVHGSLKSPLFQYILGQKAARSSFKLLKTPLCFFGHTHLPIIYKLKGRKLTVEGLVEDENLFLDKEARYLINPGSIGQPRDGDPRASYLIFDNKNYSVCLKRVAYNVSKTQKTMLKANLPQPLISRLTVGQ
ncbi:MAG: metallophosphoesterase [Actinobacteria bacterium]|nr:MAG: metallophosphoesterase [Actinomycetota bacterium]